MMGFPLQDAFYDLNQKPLCDAFTPIVRILELENQGVASLTIVPDKLLKGFFGFCLEILRSAFKMSLVFGGGQGNASFMREQNSHCVALNWKTSLSPANFGLYIH